MTDRPAKVFLGGTKGAAWRDQIKPMLKFDYFDPIVPDWTDAARKLELEQKLICTHRLYVITKEIRGMYAVAEAVDDSNKTPQQTVFCVIKDGFDAELLRSIAATSELIRRNGAWVVYSLEEAATRLNSIMQGSGDDR